MCERVLALPGGRRLSLEVSVSAKLTERGYNVIYNKEEKRQRRQKLCGMEYYNVQICKKSL